MGATVVAIITALVGAACAAADGALLALDEEPPSGQGPQGESSDERERTHQALSIVRLLMQLATGAAAAVALRLWIRPAPVVLLLGAMIAIVALTVELGPRAVGEGYGARAARRLRPVAAASTWLFGWLVSAAAAVDSTIERLLSAGTPTAPHRANATAEHAPATPVRAAVPIDRRALVERVASLSQTEVHTVMMPRVDITGIEKDTPWSEVLDRVRSSEHARLPVYDETMDNIIGVLHAKDLLHAAVADAPPPGGWLCLVRPAMFIPEGKTVDAQLRDFKAAGTHIAIVVDEYGGTAGLVTVEDVLEEIVGDIRDEHDDEEPSIESEDGCRFWVSGRVSLDELSEALQHRIEREGIATVGGLIYDVLGRVPRAGESLTIDGFRVVVERVVRRRVQRVYFERVPALAEDAT